MRAQASHAHTFRYGNAHMDPQTTQPQIHTYSHNIINAQETGSKEATHGNNVNDPKSLQLVLDGVPGTAADIQQHIQEGHAGDLHPVFRNAHEIVSLHTCQQKQEKTQL